MYKNNFDEQPIEMISLREASKRTGLSYDRLRKMCLANEIVHFRTGKKFLLNWYLLRDMLNGVQKIPSANLTDLEAALMMIETDSDKIG